jgi:hypothetical protein
MKVYFITPESGTLSPESTKLLILSGFRSATLAVRNPHFLSFLKSKLISSEFRSKLISNLDDVIDRNYRIEVFGILVSISMARMKIASSIEIELYYYFVKMLYIYCTLHTVDPTLVLLWRRFGSPRLTGPSLQSTPPPHPT